MKAIAFLIAALLAPAAAGASPVDLDLWTTEQFGTTPAADWAISNRFGTADTATQQANAVPAVIFDATTRAQGRRYTGVVSVNTPRDDDFIGFVLGFDRGEFGSTDADFWLIDWKRSFQSAFGGTARQGLALSHVTGDTMAATEGDFWRHDGVVQEVARATDFGATG